MKKKKKKEKEEKKRKKIKYNGQMNKKNMNNE
jgi:hypothetical protein